MQFEGTVLRSVYAEEGFCDDGGVVVVELLLVGVAASLDDGAAVAQTHLLQNSLSMLQLFSIGF